MSLLPVYPSRFTAHLPSSSDSLLTSSASSAPRRIATAATSASRKSSPLRGLTTTAPPGLRHCRTRFFERLGRGIKIDAITTPVVNTSAYFFKKTADLINFKEKRHVSYEYGRYGNPTSTVLEEKISELEGAESTVLLASGMYASVVFLMALVPAGGHRF